MDSTRHDAPAGSSFVIIGSTVDGSGRITQDVVTDWLSRLQHAMIRDRSVQPASTPNVSIDGNAAEENDVIVEVQEFVPEEEITVIESGEIIRSKASGKCYNVLLHEMIPYADILTRTRIGLVASSHGALKLEKIMRIET